MNLKASYKPTFSFLILMIFTCVVYGQEITLIDFGDPAQESPETTPVYWNNLLGQNVPGTFKNLIDNTGATTGEVLTLTDIFDFNYANNNAGTTSPTGVSFGGLPLPSTAARDSFFGEGLPFGSSTETTGGFTLSGLEVGKYYSFSIFASRTSVSDNRETLYTITGNTTGTDTLDPANNTNNTATISNIQPNISGEITIQAEAGTNNTNGFRFYYIGAIEMTKTSCLSTNTTTWASGAWTNGLPNSLTKSVILNDNYNTSTDGGSFSACSLTVNPTYNLTVSNGDYIEVENDVIVDGGSISVATQGAFVQNDSAGTFSIINSGSASLNKSTRNYVDDGLHYTYWSSPVTNADITTVFANPADGRRYSFDGSNFLDEHTVGTTNGIPDDIDDDDNDWQVATGTMNPGVGYAITAVPPPPVPGPINYSDNANFTGEFNTGDIDVTIYRNDTELTDNNWNLIGNPYPSAISSDDFLNLNAYDVATNPTGTLGGVIYFWTHISTASSANGGNQVNNFSQDDYATLNLGGGVAATNGGDTPNKFIPSGQSFFATFSNDAPTTGGISPIFFNTVKFTNSMRRADGTSNSQFFKNSKSKSKPILDNKLWVNLISDNGVFNQILVAYVGSATEDYDGDAYDAPKNLSSGASAILYSNIENSSKKYVIQGKAPSDLTETETINLGFKTTITVATLYKLSIDHLEGDFLTGNTVYLKDNLLNKLHDLSASDYTFTSEVGEFNSRFQIGFNAQALSADAFELDENILSIVELENDNIKFTVSNNSNIKSVAIFDVLGRQLYSLKGRNSTETYKLSNLNNSIFIAKVTLSSGAIITKKAIKK